MEKIQKRINALRNNQLEIDQAEVKLSEDIIQLECKHAAVFEALYKKREAIVNGEREPSEGESKWEYEIAEKEDDDKEKIDDPTQPGVPGFWLKALEFARITKQIIHDDDRAILKHLKNITLKQKSERPFGFTLEFHFGPNEYFKNEVLTKTYEFTDETDAHNPLLNHYNSFYKLTGCTIEWNEGKDVTVRSVKKTQKNKSTGVTRVINVNEKKDSFFNFFTPVTPDGVRPSYKTNQEHAAQHALGHHHHNHAHDHEADEEAEDLYEADFQIGDFIKGTLIPKAVLYYTGEATEEDDEDEDEEEDDEDDDEDEDDNENDDNEQGENPDGDNDNETNGRGKNNKKNKQTEGKEKRLKP